ncbi:MAG: hypothetical protein GXO42_02220 [bacterium]|nr:hypothetical protein [bacterium]
MQPPQKKKPPLVGELENLLNSPVIVVLKDGRIVKGTLRAFDPGHLNIVLYGVTEQFADVEKKYTKMIIRGDSIEYIASHE